MLGTIVYEDVQSSDDTTAVQEMVSTEESWTQEEKEGDPEMPGRA